MKLPHSLAAVFLKRSFFFLPVVLLVLAGCTDPRIERTLKDIPVGTPYAPGNVYSVGTLPRGFDRVLLLPPTDPSGEPLSPDLTDAFLSSLSLTNRFQLIPSSESQRAISGLSVASPLLLNRPVSAEILQVADRLGADGILELHVTQYRPYKPFKIGVQSRLVGLESGHGRVLWEFDELFDAGQRSVVTGARMYAEKYLDQRYPLQSSYSVFISPVRFAGYVGLEMFQTLPMVAGDESDE